MQPCPAPATLSFPEAFPKLANPRLPCNYTQNTSTQLFQHNYGMLNTYPQNEGYDTIQIVKIPLTSAQPITALERKRRVYPSAAPPDAPDQTAVDVTFRMGDAC